MNRNESEYTVKATTAVSPAVRTGTADRQGVQYFDCSDTQQVDHQSSQADSSESGSASSLDVGKSGISAVIRTLFRVRSMAELVRYCGAGLIVFALSLFLMQGVDATNDLQRFYLLLVQTALLGSAGFAVGYLLKEPRGARMFFSLGLISIPGNFAVLGAMIYSIMPADGLITQYPDYANWQASSTTEMSLAIVAGVIVLVPMALFAFSVFARSSRRWLTVGYLTGAAVLLIPVRDMRLSSALAVLLVVGVLALIRHQRSAGITLLTGEERFAQALLFLPPALLVLRSAMLYSSEFSLMVATSSIAYLAMRQLSKNCQKTSWLHTGVHLLTALLACSLAALFSSLFALYGFFSNATLIYTLVLAALLLDLSRMVPSQVVRWWMHTVWALLCLPAFFGSYFFLPGGGSMMLALGVCLLMIVSGIAFLNRLVVVLGILALVAHLATLGSDMIVLMQSGSWATLGIAGAAILITGSLMDRYGVSARLKIQSWGKQ